jgi:hypothetical protein
MVPMSDPYEDFIQGMPLDELSRFVRDLSRKYGVTDEEMEAWRRLSPAQRMQALRELEDKMRRRHEEDPPPPGTGREM